MLGGDSIITVDLHGMRVEEAKKAIDAALSRATAGTYRIRCIHGYNHGTRLRQMIRREYGYGLEPRVIRITEGENEGITELVLREY